MKIFTTKMLGLVISALLLGACSQMATYENEDLTNGLEKADQPGFKLSPFGSNSNLNLKEYSEDACTTSCITEDPESWFVKSYEHIFDDTSDPVKKVIVDVYNTPTDLKYYIHAEGTTFKYLKIDGDLKIDNVVSTTYTHTVPLGAFGTDWNACEVEDAFIEVFRNNLTGGGAGTKAEINTSYKLVGVCTGCDIEGEEFMGEALLCGNSREAVFTFGSENGVEYFKIQGGLTNFTGDNATVYINDEPVVFSGTVTDKFESFTGIVDGYTVSQRIPGGSSNRNIRVEGGLGSCEDVEVRIEWNSTNTGGIITGDWTVEGGDGVELAPAVAGLTCS